MTAKPYEEEEGKRPFMTDEEAADALLGIDAMSEEDFAEIMDRLDTQDISVVWLSSDTQTDEEAPGGINPSLSQIGAELAAQTHEKQAAFEKGDVVVTLNPYTGDILLFEPEVEDMPRFFEILDVAWDRTDATFRYLVSDLGKWIAEGWLDVPDLPIMAKTRTELSVSSSVEAEAKLRSQVDELTTEFISNTYLDMMRATDPMVRAKGLEGMKAMAAEGMI